MAQTKTDPAEIQSITNRDDRAHDDMSFYETAVKAACKTPNINLDANDKNRSSMP